MVAGSVDTQLLTASIVLGALISVLAGGAEAQGVPGLVEGVAGEAGADHAAKVGGALLLTQPVLGTAWILQEAPYCQAQAQVRLSLRLTQALSGSYFVTLTL